MGPDVTLKLSRLTFWAQVLHLKSAKLSSIRRDNSSAATLLDILFQDGRMHSKQICMLALAWQLLDLSLLLLRL